MHLEHISVVANGVPLGLQAEEHSDRSLGVQSFPNTFVAKSLPIQLYVCIYEDF